MSQCAWRSSNGTQSGCCPAISYRNALLISYQRSDVAIPMPTSKKTIHIIRSGQRRLSFCEELSRSETQERDLHQDGVVYSKLETLGILFLDDIPDSR